MTITAAPTGFDWEAAGRDLGTGCDDIHAVAVLGSDPTQTALVALGIAREQSRRRRVAIGDLLGDAEPLQNLMPSDDHHGLADVFDYGVSLSRIAHKVEKEGDLFILPTGAFITDYASILAHRRWSLLAAGFRQEKGLLIVAAHVGAPHIEALVVQLDGAILVGESVPARLPVSRVLGTVRAPRPKPPPPRRIEGEAAAKAKSAARRRIRRVWGSVFGVTLALVLGIVGLWLAERPLARSTWAPAWLKREATSLRSILGMVRLDTSAARDGSIANAAPALGLLTAADSASRVPYGIALQRFNTQAGALLELRQNGATLPAGTFTPVLSRDIPWFRVIAGAYPDSVSAAALLDTLRGQGRSDAARAKVERFPYALLIARDVPDTSAASRVAQLQARGIPVYALRQLDGTARLYAGAFQAPEEARLLADALRASGVSASLVYRTGRVD